MNVDTSKNLAKITYLILIQRSEVSHFNKYETLKIKQQSVISHILTLPKNIYEIYMTKENIIYRRIQGLVDGYDINYIYEIYDIKKYPTETKCIVVSNRDDIDEIIEKITTPIIFLSENLNDDKLINLYNFSSLNIEKFQDIFENLLSSFNKKVQQEFFKIKEYSLTEKTGTHINIEPILTEHLYTSTNLLTLRSMRANFSWEKEDEIEEEDIIQSINLIKHISNDLYKKLHQNKPFKFIYKYLLSDVSYNLDFSLNEKDYTKYSLIKNNSKIENFTEFTNSLKYMKKDDLLVFNNDSNPYIDDYYSERLYIEKLIAIQTSSFCIPNIKLKIINNNYKSLLKEIGRFSRGNNVNINKSFLKLEKQFKTDIKDWFEYIKTEYSHEIKLVSNLPLEWSSTDDLPLMIKHEVSRIPVSFGNVAEKLLMDTEQIVLSVKGVSKILFLSSFEEDDTLKYQLQKKVKITKENNKNLNKILDKDKHRALLDSYGITKERKIDLNSENNIEIQETWKDISTLDELIDALNRNTSPIVVFDLHGGHDEKGEGVILIKGEPIPISKLFEKVKIPPIVILSSCDTNPLDRNHYNTANAFLLMGAKTVLASAVPILANEASTFIARLITRISSFLPIRLNETKQSIRWSEFITGMNRQSYYKELIDKLQIKYQFNSELKYQLIFFVNMSINPLHKDFNKRILKKISTEIDKSEKDINNFIQSEFKFPECLKYIQMGNPELITIATEETLVQSFQN